MFTYTCIFFRAHPRVKIFEHIHIYLGTYIMYIYAYIQQRVHASSVRVSYVRILDFIHKYPSVCVCASMFVSMGWLRSVESIK